ncbi:Nuclear receptor domain-containing protein [Caenorhabditis elegans]|uniref:Nuclear receptor domain-containing protein n=1 Tax=Caenorhabditis elegans TaxID=6239 RepID=A0A5E4LX31_CAEEL|nr:Nuclear receptor domain-containing protein [Caenorhabditis elegans]VVC12415.1 Nuclear receptor domain-containing protein [Caenorhabditis elegans]
MPSNNSVATNMYNTRRSAYMNSCSTAMELPPQSLHQNWQDTEYVNTTCSSDMNSDMSMYNDDKDDPFYEDEGSGGGTSGGGKKSSRKRANTTSSSGGNEKESKRTANKVCRVCGDKAFSYNFNVITCESCKAFFRRNANKEKEIRCPFNEQCEINMVSRRFCQRCRLTKCFAVGMKKEWIMSEEARLEKKQRVEENRERRLQDAMNRALEEACMEDESENSYDEAPAPSHQMSVRQYLANDDAPHKSSDEVQPHLGHHGYNQKEDKMMNFYQDGPSDQGYSNHDFDYSLPSNSCASSSQLDTSVNCGATTIADNGASPSNTVTIPAAVDVERKPIPTNVLFSASMSAIQDVAGMCAPDVVNENLMNVAQAAVQAQAIVNHTQQLAAAVVAQQVVSNMAPVMPTVNPLDPLLAPAFIAPPMPTPINVPITTPIAGALSTPLPPPIVPPGHSSINPVIPIIPKEMPVSVSLLNQLEQTPAEMVTVPKDMLMKLIQKNSRSTCTCSCMCGRYPPGSCIVDEVTKDLLNGGSSNSSNATDRDETRLETTEDMQMNGLLPGDCNSSIQWLNQQSSAQAFVDPITHSMTAEEAQTQRERRDSIFGSFSAADQGTVTQPKSVQEETIWEHTVAENESRELSDEEIEKMEELTEISNQWISMRLDSMPILDLFSKKNVEKIVNGLKLLSSFRFLPQVDKRSVVKRGLFNYCVVKWMQHKESMSIDGLSDAARRDFMNIIRREEFNYRVQPGAFNTLAISVLFHSISDNLISTDVYMEHLVFKKLLDKNLPIKVSSDTVYNNYYPYIIKAAKHLEKATKGLSDELVAHAVS